MSDEGEQEAVAMVKQGSSEQSRLSRFADRPGRPEPGLRITRLPGGHGLAVAGEIDVATHRDWEAALATLPVSDVTRLDLSDLSFIDAHGAAMLMSVAGRMALDEPLTLYQPPLCLRRLLDLFWSEGQGEIVIVDEEAA